MLLDFIFLLVAIALILLITFCYYNKWKNEKIAILLIIFVILALYGIVNYDSEKKITLIPSELISKCMRQMNDCQSTQTNDPTISSILANEKQSDMAVNILLKFQEGINKSVDYIKLQKKDLFQGLTELSEKKNDLDKEIINLKDNEEKAMKLGELFVIDVYLKALTYKIQPFLSCGPSAKS